MDNSAYVAGLFIPLVVAGFQPVQYFTHNYYFLGIARQILLWYKLYSRAKTSADNISKFSLVSNR